MLYPRHVSKRKILKTICVKLRTIRRFVIGAQDQRLFWSVVFSFELCRGGAQGASLSAARARVSDEGAGVGDTRANLRCTRERRLSDCKALRA